MIYKFILARATCQCVLRGCIDDNSHDASRFAAESRRDGLQSRARYHHAIIPSHRHLCARPQRPRKTYANQRVTTATCAHDCKKENESVEMQTPGITGRRMRCQARVKADAGSLTTSRQAGFSAFLGPTSTFTLLQHMLWIPRAVKTAGWRSETGHQGPSTNRRAALSTGARQEAGRMRST